MLLSHCHKISALDTWAMNQSTKKGRRDKLLLELPVTVCNPPMNCRATVAWCDNHSSALCRWNSPLTFAETRGTKTLEVIRDAHAGVENILPTLEYESLLDTTCVPIQGLLDSVGF